MRGQKERVGIIAYGSLISEPGKEIEACTSEIVRDYSTPFKVEFARSSGTRAGAPTLVPHEAGAPVNASIIVLECSVEAARDILWRRETRTLDRSLRYPGDRQQKRNAVNVGAIEEQGFASLLYTQIGANIPHLNPPALAELAIKSVGAAEPGLDGISYLIAAKGNGIVTPLSSSYEKEILSRTHTSNLGEALAKLLRIE